MPIYAYRCESCGHAQDLLQKMSDPVLTVCPACGASSYVKQLTAAGFQLKGSGWYVTDFRGGNTAAKKEEGTAGDKEAGAANDKPGDGKPDGKPDAKPDAKPADSKPADTKSAPAAAASSTATPPAAKPAAPTGGS